MEELREAVPPYSSFPTPAPWPEREYFWAEISLVHPSYKYKHVLK